VENITIVSIWWSAGGTTTTFLYAIECMRNKLALDLGTSKFVGGKQTRKYPQGG
jgi:hypothetical protein